MRRIATLVCALGLLAGPALAAPNARDLVEIADLSSLAVSPDGRVALVREDRASVAANRYALTWWAVDPEGLRAPVRLGDAGEPIFEDAGVLAPEAVQWSGDSRWAYYRSLADGQVQVWRARTDGSRVEQVTHDPADVAGFSVDPATLAVTYTTGEPREAIRRAETAEYDAGILADHTLQPGQAAFRGMRINGRMASQRLTGSWFSHRGLLDDRPLHRRRLGADGRVEDLGEVPRTPEDLRAGISRANAAGETAFVKEAGSTDSPLSARLASGRTATCAAAACGEAGITGLDWVEGGRRVFFVARQADRTQRLGVWDPATGRVRRLADPEGQVGGRYRDQSCAVAGARAVCIVAGPVGPARLEAFELAAPRRTVLLDPNREVRARVAMRFERLSWSAGGHDFHGVLFRPQGVPAGRPAPLFIQYYHCDSYIRGGEGDEYPMPVLAARGVAALCVDTARIAGMTPEKQDALLTYDVAVEGLRAIVARLAARGLVDPARVGMGGLSFGSEVTMRTLVRSDLLRAAAISSTEMEPIYYWFNRRDGRDFAAVARRVWGIGAPDETPERWKEVSFALNAAAINAPLLMQLPEEESRYNYELLGRLQMRKVPVEMVVFPDEPHIKFQPRHKLAVYERNLDWFGFWLQGECEPRPGDGGRCGRWRKAAAAWDAARGGAGSGSAASAAVRAPQPRS